jgi:hypothetical protein
MTARIAQFCLDHDSWSVDIGQTYGTWRVDIFDAQNKFVTCGRGPSLDEATAKALERVEAR